jgi:hypothetical protein
MPDPIEVNYVPDGDDWQVTVSGRGQRLTGRAPGLIAARDRADQLVEKVAPEAKFRTVVHLLNGNALEFTTAYLTARLGKPSDAEPARPAGRADGKAPRPSPAPKPVEPPAPRTDSDGAPQRAGAKHGAKHGTDRGN